MVAAAQSAFTVWERRRAPDDSIDKFAAINKRSGGLGEIVETVVGLIPVMWATGIRADVMKRLAAPMVGGVLSAMLLTLVVIPALYVMWVLWSQGKRWTAETPGEG